MGAESIKMCRKCILKVSLVSYSYYDSGCIGKRSDVVWMLLVLGWIMAGCVGGTVSTADLSTDTRSSDLPSEAVQIEFLGRYVALRSEVSETEFHIVYHDNSDGLVPGPSDWDIKAVMVVDDVAPWMEGKTAVETADFSWVDSMVTERLRPSSSPLFFSNGSTTIAVYEPENIVFFQSTTTP